MLKIDVVLCKQLEKRLVSGEEEFFCFKPTTVPPQLVRVQLFNDIAEA
jgi:hypothetical protein